MTAHTADEARARGADRGPARPHRGTAWLPALAAVAAWSAAMVLIWFFAAYARSFLPFMGDLRVYRDAGAHVLAGRVVYAPVPPAELPELGRSLLVFTYPPVAAILAVPLALLSWHATELAWVPVVYLPLVVVVWLSFRPLLARAGRWAPAVFGVVFIGCMCLCPMVQEIRFGQIDIMLAALCLADIAVRRPRWPRGLLIGLATAIKLTPGVFIVYLLLTGRRRAAAVSAMSMAGFTVLAWLLIPRDSVAYWTRALLQPDRLGPNGQVSDQSIRAMLLRAFTPEPVPTLLWLALAAVVACAGFAAARAAWQRGDEIAGVAIVGLVAVLVSPVSWIHHMIWVVAALGAIVGNATSWHRWRVALGTAAFFLLVLPYAAWDRLFEDYAPATLQVAVQDSYGIAAAMLIVILALLPAPERGVRPVALPRPGSGGQQGEPAQVPWPGSGDIRLLEPHAGTGQR